MTAVPREGRGVGGLSNLAALRHRRLAEESGPRAWRAPRSAPVLEPDLGRRPRCTPAGDVPVVIGRSPVTPRMTGAIKRELENNGSQDVYIVAIEATRPDGSDQNHRLDELWMSPGAATGPAPWSVAVALTSRAPNEVPPVLIPGNHDSPGQGT